ncbi:MAG: cell filamentation protein Fic [Bdellovibrionales bacterium RIFOXYD1_FULL_53_11]|nr:MAG: cell filamentation protein Fic [Bdellovibrionales bacterium RIFOXYD1_FULL_53_11]
MFRPVFTISNALANRLMKIEAAKQAIAELPITPKLLASLRATARLQSTHYSTMIEGNRLTLQEAKQVIEKTNSFPARQRDEKEVLGYYRALDEVEKLASRNLSVPSEKDIQTIHAIVMNGGKIKNKPTPYRDGQNVIKDSRSGGIVYMPPEAKDVPKLMREFVKWLDDSGKKELPCPLRAAIAHYQFATIHPYYDGNGRTSRLLATLMLHLGGYGLKGLYSLEEYYANDLPAYYHAIAIGPSHNYYMGRAEADISGWLEYFCAGMAHSFENVRRQAARSAAVSSKDKSKELRLLDTRQRRVLELFQDRLLITAPQVGVFLGVQPRTASLICSKWVECGFLTVADPANKSRKYALAKKFRNLAENKEV